MKKVKRNRLFYLGLILLIIVVAILYFKTKINYINKNIDAIDNLIATTDEVAFFDAYFHVFKEYPDSFEEIDEIFELEELDFYESDKELFYDIMKDPFTDYKEFYKYYPIKQNGKNIDYITYSVGIDGIDNNKKNIDDFNKGMTDSLLFQYLSFDSNNVLIPFLLKKKGDFIINIPKTSSFVLREYMKPPK